MGERGSGKGIQEFSHSRKRDVDIPGGSRKLIATSCKQILTDSDGLPQETLPSITQPTGTLHYGAERYMHRNIPSALTSFWCGTCALLTEH